VRALLLTGLALALAWTAGAPARAARSAHGGPGRGRAPQERAASDPGRPHPQDRAGAERGAEARGGPDGRLEEARRRWQRLSEEERALLRRRYEEFRALDPAVRAELERRAARLRDEEDDVLARLAPEWRRRFAELPAPRQREVLEELVADPDPGIRKVARESAPKRPSSRLAALLEETAPDAEGLSDQPGASSTFTATSETMPGERVSEAMPGGGTGLMPGEAEPGMPGDSARHGGGGSDSMPN